MKVFICSNKHQMIAAKVSKNSILSRSSLKDDDVKIISKESFGFMNSLDNSKLIRDGSMFSFGDDDMQNFTLLRFHVPELMKYEGKALVIDPDIFLIRNGIEKILIDTQEHVLLSRKGKRRITGVQASCQTTKNWNIGTFQILLTK